MEKEQPNDRQCSTSSLDRREVVVDTETTTGQLEIREQNSSEESWTEAPVLKHNNSTVVGLQRGAGQGAKTIVQFD